MKNAITSFVAMFMIALLVVASCMRHDDAVYDVYQNSTITELKDKGNEFLRNDQPDSALFYYTLSAGKYRDNLPDSLKLQCAIANCNAGYVYLFYHNDYASSYTCTLDAFDIMEQCSGNNLLSRIYLNLGNIYLDYREYGLMLDNYKDAFNIAVENNEHDVALITISTLMAHAINDNNRSTISEELKIFDRLNLGDQKGYKGIKLQREALSALDRGDWETAVKFFEKARDNSDLEFVSERFKKLCDYQIACILTNYNRYDEAIQIVRRTALDSLESLDIRSQSVSMLADLYDRVNLADSSLKYSRLYNMLSDSLFRTQQYGAIRDIGETRKIKKLDARLLTIEGEKYRFRTAFLAALAGVIMILVFSFVLLRQNRALKERNRELFRRHQEVMEAEHKVIEAEHKEQEVRKSLEEKSPQTRIDDKLQNDILAAIKDILENEEEILSNEFSLTRLAEMVGSNTHYVSQIINEIYQKNFNTLLGELRVKIACQRLCDTEQNGNLTIEAIAESVGFKSRSNFVVVFKKVTGLTPSQYKKIAIEEQVR